MVQSCAKLLRSLKYIVIVPVRHSVHPSVTLALTTTTVQNWGVLNLNYPETHSRPYSTPRLGVYEELKGLWIAPSLALKGDIQDVSFILGYRLIIISSTFCFTYSNNWCIRTCCCWCLSKMTVLLDLGHSKLSVLTVILCNHRVTEFLIRVIIKFMVILCVMLYNITYRYWHYGGFIPDYMTHDVTLNKAPNFAV
jgi:hypothetical protein